MVKINLDQNKNKIVTRKFLIHICPFLFLFTEFMPTFCFNAKYLSRDFELSIHKTFYSFFFLRKRLNEIVFFPLNSNNYTDIKKRKEERNSNQNNVQIYRISYFLFCMLLTLCTGLSLKVILLRFKVNMYYFLILLQIQLPKTNMESK